MTKNFRIAFQYSGASIMKRLLTSRTLLSSVFLLSILITGCGSENKVSPSSSSTSTASSRNPAKAGPSVGENAILDNTGTRVTVAATEEDLEAYFKVLQAQDALGSMEMERAGKIFKVSDKSKVLILEVNGPKTKVRVMNGKDFGKAGWVMTPNVKPDTDARGDSSRPKR